MKRFLLFLLLIAIGVVALRFAIGVDEAVQANTPDPKRRPPAAHPPGITTQKGSIGASVSQTGPLEFPRYRSIPLGNGETRHEQVFFLRAKDSRPVTDALQELDDVEVLFFEHGEPMARLEAQRAFVELSRDGAGKTTLNENKDLDLRDAVFTTLPGTKMAGLRAELGNARVHITEEEVQLSTATENDPVRVVMDGLRSRQEGDGSRSGTLTGNGLQARLPRDRKSPVQRADLEILHDPLLTTAGLTARAKGRLHYVEDLSASVVQLTLDDDVHVDLEHSRLRLPGAGADNTPSTIHGDQLTAWLQREKRDDAERGRETMVWRQLLLVGAPAVVEIGDDRLHTPKIKVLPGPFGDVCQVTAYGGESTIEVHRSRFGRDRGEGPVRGTSPRRIHLLSPGNSVGAMHRQFGFPAWALRPFDQVQVAVFEGAARLDDGAHSVVASKGMRLYTRDGSSYGIAQGAGDVVIDQRKRRGDDQDLVVKGNDGFFAVLTDRSQQWRLGPPQPPVAELGSPRWRAHHYEVQHGAASAWGSGACEVTCTDDHVHVHLRAPGPTIVGRLPTQGVELDGVDLLDADLHGNDVVALEAAGLPARALRTDRGDVVTARAPRLQQIGPRSLRLLSAPGRDPDRVWAELAPEHARPVLSRTMAATEKMPAMHVQVEGPQIDAHHLGGSDVFVDAAEVGDWQPVVNATWTPVDGTGPTTTSFTASRLRALPFAMTREARMLHAGAASNAFTAVAWHAIGRPWLIADDVHHFRLDSARYGLVEGHGKRLLLAQGAEAALFVGDPDTLTPAEVTRTQRDQVATARGARVRVFREEKTRLQALRTFADRPTFLVPSVTLHDSQSTDLLAHMTASCQGSIDVFADSILFQGPVTAQSLRPGGEADPAGMHIDARGLQMFRHGESQIARIVGTDVDLVWSLVHARSAEVEVDLRWSRLVARDPNGASVELPDRRTWTAPRIEVNYETMAVTTYQGLLRQGANQEAAAAPRAEAK